MLLLSSKASAIAGFYMVRHRSLRHAGRNAKAAAELGVREAPRFRV